MDKNKGKILIVDDEVYIQEILKATLEDAGFECLAVSDAAAALSCFASQHIDLAFLDIRIPGAQGMNLLQEIRTAHPDVTVLMITAVDNTATAVECMRMGAYDYIVKPFNLEQILASTSRALDRRRLENTNREHEKYLAEVADERAAETRRLFYSMTQVLIRLLEFKTPYNTGHALRVAEMSRHVARELRMTEDGIHKVYVAALLHDVGTITVQDMLLLKQDKLTKSEQRQIQERTSLADDVLRPILNDEEVLKYIRHHRERYDGTGYPDGLKGNIIPLGARIISVVEAFDAIITGRPYRLPRSSQQAIEELARCTQTQFDPHVVTVFSDLYERVFSKSKQFSVGQP